MEPTCQDDRQSQCLCQNGRPINAREANDGRSANVASDTLNDTGDTGESASSLGDAERRTDTAPLVAEIRTCTHAWADAVLPRGTAESFV